MMLDLDGGWIYVMMTPSDDNRFKLGRTKKNPLDRLKALRTADPHIFLYAAYFIPNSIVKLSRLEAVLHQHFEGRIKTADDTLTEWFDLEADVAQIWVESYLKDWFEKDIKDMPFVDDSSIYRAFESHLNDLYDPKKSFFDDTPSPSSICFE